MEDDKNRILHYLEKNGTSHLRRLLLDLNIEYSRLINILDTLEKQKFIEKFSHGGYIYYRLTSEGFNQLHPTKDEE